jgi:hypothetical protein
VRDALLLDGVGERLGDVLLPDDLGEPLRAVFSGDDLIDIRFAEFGFAIYASNGNCAGNRKSKSHSHSKFKMPG